MTTKVAGTAENKGFKSTRGLQCVGYFRKSSRSEEWERQQEENEQKDAICTKVAGLNGSISFYLSDPVRLAMAIEKPGMMTAITMLESDLADVLIVPSIAVIAYTSMDLVSIIKTVVELGKRLILLEEGIDTATDAGRLLALTAIGSQSTKREGLQRLARGGSI